ncbi:hypothetical protein [Virgibacillus sp. DJP39]|uniref:hypothetical protein n=1 Tax=Virgibacillus sp. DJP39 TaxID=3409790 RepID=UPI003BB69DDD
MIPIKNKLRQAEINSYEVILEGSPFTLSDFYYEENNPFFVVLDKGLQHYMLFGFNEEILRFEIPRLSKQYELIVELEKEKDYKKIFGVWVEKRVLLKRFLEYFNLINDEEKFDIFIDVYNRSEYGFNEYINESFIKNIVKYRSPESIYTPHFTDKKIKVYRGVGRLSTSPFKAYSWTLDKETAQWFSTRFKDVGEVYEAYIETKNIVAYIEKRNEKEVVVLPSKLKEINQI